MASRRVAGQVHEAAWAAMKKRPFVWGTFVWYMFDFAVSTRHEGGVPGRNDKGLVPTTAKSKRTRSYFYKANWSDEPVLYITSRRFHERTNAVTDVKVYSNDPLPHPLPQQLLGHPVKPHQAGQRNLPLHAGAGDGQRRRR